jgi:speckle-type POZ protein
MAEHCDTYSSIVAEAVSGSHVLKIDGYSRTKELLQNGTCAASIASSVGGHGWIIKYYPNGDRKEDADFISLYLALDSSDAKDVKAKFRVSLLGKDDAPVSSYSFNTIRTFSSKSSGWGFPQFIKRGNLEGSVHLRDDCFIIRCLITVVKEKQKAKCLCKCLQATCTSISPDVLKNMDGTVETFDVGGVIFRAHRGVLAAMRQYEGERQRQLP